MRTNAKSQAEILNDSRWPVVSFRMKREELDEIRQFSKQPTYGKAVKFFLRRDLAALHKADFSCSQAMKPVFIPTRGDVGKGGES